MRWVAGQEAVSVRLAVIICKSILSVGRKAERAIACCQRWLGGGEVRRELIILLSLIIRNKTGSPLFTGLVPSARNGNLLYPLSQFQLHIAVSIHIHNGRKLPEEGAPRSHEYWRQQSLCRLQRSLASMGICQLRHLHLSRMLRRAQRIRCTHLLRKKYHHG